MNKIERMMGIILALNKKKKMTAREIADLFEVDIRTIYRDIQAISEMNVPVVSYVGNEGGYSLMDEYFIPPVSFNRDEVLALLLSKKIIDIVDIPGYTKHVKSAYFKLKNVMSETFVDELEHIEAKILFDVKNVIPEADDLKFFEIIKNCLEKNLKLKIHYFSTKRFNTKEHIVRPYGLIYEDGEWYLAAYCELNSEITTFRIHRIKNVEMVNERFEYPRDFNISDYNCRNNYMMDYSNPNSQLVKLRLTKSLYYSVKDNIIFKYSEHIEMDDHFILNIKTTNPDRYVYYAFQFFNGMEILEPRWLRDDFKKRLERLYEIYK